MQESVQLLLAGGAYSVERLEVLAGPTGRRAWPVEFSAPQIAGRAEPFRSDIREHAKGRTEALEELAVEILGNHSA